VAGIIAGLFVAAFLAGAGMAGLRGDNPGEGLLLLGILAAGLIVAPFIAYYAFWRQKLGSHGSPPSGLPPAEPTNQLLPEHPSPAVMSVTEQTTARLEEQAGRQA
jgi:hypothetical protein